MIHHADPVAEDGSPTEGGRWVDSNHPHAFVELAVLGDELVHQGRLARTWIARNANDLRVARSRVEHLQRVLRARSPVIKQPHEFGGCTDLSVFDPFDQGLNPRRRIRFGIGCGHRRSIGSTVGAVNGLPG